MNAKNIMDFDTSGFSTLVDSKVEQGELTPRQISDSMGITPNYLALIRRGARPWAGLGRRKLVALAKRLGMSPINVFLATGYVRREDFK